MSLNSNSRRELLSFITHDAVMLATSRFGRAAGGRCVAAGWIREEHGLVVGKDKVMAVMAAIVM